MTLTLPLSFKLFTVVFVFFHASEFILACVYMRSQLSLRSTLFSKPYFVALSIALAEYFAELQFLGRMKEQTWLTAIGLAIVVVGEVCRKTAMVTAAGNFTHDIRRQKVKEHVLVTHGIYRYIRHPGYLGWYVWAVGTQVLLANPFCVVFYITTIWSFFRQRIRVEEQYLCRFFGDAYSDYAAKTPTFLPYIP